MAEIKQTDYQFYEPLTGFDPLKVPDYAGAVRKKQQEDLDKVKEAMDSEVARDRTVVAAAEQEARNLSQLAELSGTIFKQVTDIAKTTAENREINDTYDAIFGAQPVTPEEEQEVVAAAAINEVNNDAANAVQEETGDPGVANYVRNETPAGVVSRNFRSDRARLLAAQTDYASFQASYLNSDAVINVGGQSIPVRVAVRSGDAALVQAAIAQGRGEFARAYGIHQANRAQAVSMLQGTITNVDAQLATGFINQGIKEQREEDQRLITSQSFIAGESSDVAELGRNFQQLADQAWTSGAYDSRADANKAVVDGMLKGLVQRGDVDAIDALGGELKVANQNGTELINSYAVEFAAAREQALNQQNANISQGVTDIKAQMFESLASATNQQQRDGIIEDAARQLEAQGSYEQARQLRQQRDDLVVVGAAERNAADLLQGIRTGEITNANQIDEQVLLGNITEQDGKYLKGQLSVSNGANPPENETAKSIVSDYVTRAQTDVLSAIGMQRDQFGNLVPGSVMSVGDAEIITGQIERDVNLLANTLIQNNPSLVNDPIRLQAALGEELKRWTQENLFSPDGKFSIAGLKDSQTGTFEQDPAAIEANISHLRRLVNSPQSLAAPSVPQSSFSQPVNYISIVQSPGGLTPHLARNFNPLRGDRLFSQADVVKLRDEFKNGTTSPHLERTSNAVGLTPRALLQQQSNVYGLGSVPAPQFKSQGNVPITAVEGAKLLMSMGLPTKGSSWLAGNVMTESSWVPNKQPWDDGGELAGGLASWRGSRLEDLEQHFGRPVSLISTREQLQYLVKELKNYPEADRIFRNPYASDRQLMRASKIFWVYGEEGKRFDYARGVEGALTRETDPRYRTPIRAASAYKGADTSAGPDKGINACVWAINKAFEAQGMSVPWGDSVYVPEVKNILDRKGQQLDGPQPGAIAIMTDDGNPPYPHIGIVQADGTIISNSSSRSRFDWVDTPEAYERRYGGKNLYYAI